MNQAKVISPLRMRIKDRALFWAAGKIGGMDANQRIRGTEYIMKMYRDTISGPPSTVKAFAQESSRELIERGTAKGLWLSKAYRPAEKGYRQMMVDLENKSGGVMWCGIFATWVLKQAGINASWNGGIQAPSNNVELVLIGKNSSPSLLDGIAPGDVCVTNHGGLEQHHVIIIEASPGTDAVTVVEGNWPLPRHTVRRSNTYKKSHFHTLYKVHDHERIHFGDGRWGHRHL